MDPSTTFLSTASRNSDEEIIQALREHTNLEHFMLQDAKDADKIVSSLLDLKLPLKTFICKKKFGPSWPQVRAMLEDIDSIRTLETFCGNKLFYMDFAKFYGKIYKDGNLCAFSSRTPQVENYTMEGNPNTIIQNTWEKFPELLASKGDNLRYLIIGPNISSELLDSIYSLNCLRKLCMICQEGSANIDIYSLILLRHLEDLHLLLLSSETTTYFSPVLSVCPSPIVKLEICCEDNLRNVHLRMIWEVCPNLEHLKVKVKFLNSLAFKGIGNCKKMKHLDLSRCTPGFNDKLLKILTEECPKLTFLDLSDSSQRMFYDIRILTNCNHLNYLYLNNQIIVDEYIIYIPRLFPILREIQLSRCENLNDPMIRKLKEIMPYLQITTDL